MRMAFGIKVSGAASFLNFKAFTILCSAVASKGISLAFKELRSILLILPWTQIMMAESSGVKLNPV